MGCYSEDCMKRNERGFTLLELLFTLAVSALIAVIFFRSLSEGFSVWDRGGARLNSAQKSQGSLPELNQKLKGASKILDVSLSSNESGYVVYQDNAGQQIAVYKNSAQNNRAFGENTFKENTLVVRYGTDKPEVLLTDVSKFKIISYTDYEGDRSARTPYKLRIASPNNTVAPVNFDDITSFRISIGKTDGDVPYELTLLSTLDRGRLDNPGEVTFGESFNGTTQLLFGGADGTAPFTLKGVEILEEPLRIDDDALMLSIPIGAVRIASTGKFFTTIRAAIAAAKPSQDIWVSEGVYDAAVSLNAGIRLLGGFDRETWIRDVNANPTIIRMRPGVHAFGVRMGNNTTLDGFEIDGETLSSQAIILRNVSNVTLSNLEIYDIETGIDARKSSFRLQNSTISVDSRSINAQNNGLIELYRNKFISQNSARESNLYFFNSFPVIIANSLIFGGDIGVETVGDDDPMAVKIINSVIKGAEEICLSFTDVTYEVVNNIVHSCVAGMTFDSPIGNNVHYNIVADVDLTSPGLVLPGDNLVLSEGQWDDGESYVTDLTSYLPVQGSPLIDSGSPAEAYNDYVYDFESEFPAIGSNTEGALTPRPSKGTARSDVGAYGGSHAGRIGVGRRTTISPSQSPQSVVEASVWPGDHVHFLGGFHSFSRVEFPHDVWVTGEHEDTLLINSSGTAALNMRGRSEISNLVIDGSSRIGVLSTAGSVLRLSGVVVYGSNIGAYFYRSQGVINQSDFVANQEGVNVIANADDVSRVYIQHSLLVDNRVAVRNEFSQVFSIQNDYFKNSSDSAGSVESDGDLRRDPSFFDEGANLYFLMPQSLARVANGMTDRDLGAYPFTQVTGSAMSPPLESNINRRYLSLRVTVSGDPRSANGKQLGFVQPRIKSFDVEQVLTPSIIVRGPEEQIMTWDLGATVLSRQFHVILDISSYRLRTSPKVDGVKLEWGDFED